MNLFDWVMLIVTLAFAVMLAMAYFAKRINPNDSWIFAFFGLAAPILYIVNLIMALYWIVRWRAAAFLPMAVLLAGAGSLSVFFRPSLSKHYTEMDAAADITFVSFNVMGFLDKKEPRRISRMREIAEAIRELNPDILCMQEFQSTPRAPKEQIDTLLSNLPYRAVNYRVVSAPGYGWGLAIYSRFPILRSGHLDFENSTNSMLWTDVVLYRRDTVRIFNNHLQTTEINASDHHFITTPEIIQAEAEEVKTRIRNMARKLRNNYRIRAEQADSLAMIIRESPYPVIVCGDFNDTPMSYVYHKVRGDLVDTFSEKAGGGPSHTYQGFFNLFRIDYLFHSRSLRTLSYATPPCEWSDHNPVVVQLQVKK